MKLTMWRVVVVLKYVHVVLGKNSLLHLSFTLL